MGSILWENNSFPRYAIHSWRNDYYGYYRNLPFGFRAKYDRDPVIGTPIFSRRYLQSDGSYITDLSEFPILALRRLNCRCDLSTSAQNGTINKFIYNDLEDFSVIVYHAAPVVKSGFYAPGAPYQIILKSVGTKLANNCTAVTPASREFRTAVGIYDTGYSVTRIGWVDYSYTWPLQVWAGDYYDY